jgi:Lipoprotein LpqB beta-propeller domain/Sporulation and spore germination
MSSAVRRHLRAVAVLGVVAALSTACVSIPTESAVQRSRAVGVQHEPQLITNVPPGPAPGATREEVVSGFFAAMLAYPQTLTKARQFLTPDAASAWDPSKGLVVYDDEQIRDHRGVVTVRMHARGSLDFRGKWTSAVPPRSTLHINLHPVRINGEWRIADPAPGTFIDSDYFTQYFRPFSLYFFDPTLSVLTPDPVYLLLGETTATALVTDLMLGPSKELAGVAATAVPPHTELDGGVTTSSSGQVDVPLTDPVLSLSSEGRQQLAAQLTWTLRQLPEVQAISVTVSGTPLDVPGVAVKGVFGVDEFAGYDPSFAAHLGLFALSSRGLVTVTQDGVTPVAGPTASAATSARYVAVDASASLAALVKGGRVLVGATVASAEAPATWFSGGVSLLRPSWDVHQVLWLVDARPTGAVLYAVTANGARRVAAPGIDGRDVKALAVSRDGVRLAAIVQRGSTSSLVVSEIDRNSAHPAAVRLSAARPVVSPGFAVRRLHDLAWESPTTLLVLASEQRGNPLPFEVSIDGSNASALGGFLPIRPASVAAGPNVDAPVVIGDRSGHIYVQTPDLLWIPFGGTTALRAPVYPG